MTFDHSATHASIHPFTLHSSSPSLHLCIHSPTCACMNLFTHLCMHASIHQSVHACLYSLTCACMHSFTHLCMHAFIQSSIHQETHESSAEKGPPFREINWTFWKLSSKKQGSRLLFSYNNYII